MSTIATIRGELIVRIGDAEPISLGWVTIPIEAATTVDPAGCLKLSATPNMTEVRATVQAIFDRPPSVES